MRAFLLADGGLVSAAAVAVATTETASKAAFATRRTIALRAGERNGERAPVHLLAVPTIDSRLGFCLGSHLDETEAA